MATAAKKKARKARRKARSSDQDGRQDEEPWMDPQTARVNKIFPRNLTARAGYLVAGNPVVTRPEDAVANCFPGLEVDIRNLDRRFFPGLVFEFVADGAWLAYVDALEDPDLQLPRPEANELNKLLTNDEIRGPLENGKLLPATSKQE